MYHYSLVRKETIMEFTNELKKRFELFKKKIDLEKTGQFFLNKGGIILGGVLLVAIISISVAVVGKSANEAIGNESSTKYLGQSVLVDANADKVEDMGDDYFVSAVADRKQVRQEALAVLEQVAANPDVLPDTKDKALLDIAAIVKEMSVESNIESLIKAKGIEDCMAVLSDGKCTVIVKSEGLLANEVAQILEIVVTEAELSPEQVTINEMK